MFVVDQTNIKRAKDYPSLHSLALPQELMFYAQSNDYSAGDLIQIARNAEYIGINASEMLKNICRYLKGKGFVRTDLCHRQFRFFKFVNEYLREKILPEKFIDIKTPEQYESIRLPTKEQMDECFQAIEKILGPSSKDQAFVKMKYGLLDGTCEDDKTIQNKLCICRGNMRKTKERILGKLQCSEELKAIIDEFIKSRPIEPRVEKAAS